MGAHNHLQKKVFHKIYIYIFSPKQAPEGRRSKKSTFRIGITGVHAWPCQLAGATCPIDRNDSKRLMYKDL
jgi:hypothetical protein